MAVACVSDRFLRACRRQPVDLTPVWFMRQAGRYMPQYRAVRARHGLLEICQNPERAAEVTITAAEELGVDAAIIFADLLLPALPLGFHLHFNSGEGPVIEPVLRDRAAIARLPESLHGELGYVSEAIRRVAGHFPDTFPVIGFAGAPFTLASYLIEGGASRQFAHTKRIIFEDRGAWALLMQKLCPMLVEYLSEQVEAGARAIQLFDSWVGALGEADFRHAVLPYNRLVIEAVQDLGVPVIYFSTGTSGYLGALRDTGAAVLGLDWRMEMSRAWSELRGGCALQGNLDPLRLFSPAAELKSAVRHLMAQSRGQTGYIFNLGHGILPETPVENVKSVVNWVREFSAAAS